MEADIVVAAAHAVERIQTADGVVTLENADPLIKVRKTDSSGQAAHAGTNDDRVVLGGHASLQRDRDGLMGEEKRTCVDLSRSRQRWDCESWLAGQNTQPASHSQRRAMQRGRRFRSDPRDASLFRSRAQVVPFSSSRQGFLLTPKIVEERPRSLVAAERSRRIIPPAPSLIASCCRSASMRGVPR